MVRIIPVSKNCLGALFKDNERVLKQVEKAGGVKITADRETVTVDGEPANEWLVQNVLEALSYGFHPKKALKLFSEDFFFEHIDLRAALRGKDLERYKARIIGTRGKAKKTIEELSGASIAIGDESVAIMGRFDEIHAAKEAIIKILEGATHSTVYAFLERLSREKARAEFA